MQFLIADTFQDSLGRLTADEQKAVKITVFDLQVLFDHFSDAQIPQRLARGFDCIRRRFFPGL